MYNAVASFQVKAKANVKVKVKVKGGGDAAQYIGFTTDVWVGVSSTVLSNGKRSWPNI